MRDIQKINRRDAAHRKESGFVEDLYTGVIVDCQRSVTGHYNDQPRMFVREAKLMIEFLKPPRERSHRVGLPLAACSSAATRASISSISIALVA